VSCRRFIAAGLFFILLQSPFAIRCSAAELKQMTIAAFERYVRIADAQFEVETQRGGPFFWMDSMPEPGRGQLLSRLKQGQMEIRQLRTEVDGRPIQIPGGQIHHWSGIAFLPGISLEQAQSLIFDYDHYWNSYKPEIRRSKLLEHADNTCKIYFQFYKESPSHIAFNAEFEVRNIRIDSTHVISHAASTRLAELEHADLPDSSEIPVGRGNGYVWRLNYNWRLEERDGGVYVELDSIVLSRDVPPIFAWFINPLVNRVSRQTVASFLNATQRGLLAVSPQ
jgi:hypothetical protein